MKPQTIRSLRQWHQYLGLFFAPAILFFALSGAFQTLGLHESHDPAVKPIAWIAWMGDIHKHSMVIEHRPKHAPSHDAMPKPAAAPGGDHDHEPKFAPLKPFVVLLAIVLFSTTLLGVVLGLQARSSRRAGLIALVAGVIVPVVLLLV